METLYEIFGVMVQHDAAIRIQAVIRAHLVRRRLGRMNELLDEFLRRDDEERYENFKLDREMDGYW